MFLLDTNVAIAALNKRDARVADRLLHEMEARVPIILSSIVLFELRFGVSNSSRPGPNAARLQEFLTAPFILAVFDAEDAEQAGDMRARLKREGSPIGPYDVLIAAQARRRGAVLVTANQREFARVPGLLLDDWR